MEEEVKHCEAERNSCARFADHEEIETVLKEKEMMEESVFITCYKLYVLFILKVESKLLNWWFVFSNRKGKEFPCSLT